MLGSDGSLKFALGNENLVHLSRTWAHIKSNLQPHPHKSGSPLFWSQWEVWSVPTCHFIDYWQNKYIFGKVTPQWHNTHPIDPNVPMTQFWQKCQMAPCYSEMKNLHITAVHCCTVGSKTKTWIRENAALTHSTHIAYLYSVNELLIYLNFPVLNHAASWSYPKMAHLLENPLECLDILSLRT